VKERQDSLAARIADTISGGVRRRAQEREPRAVLYDAAGEPRVVAAGSEEQLALVEAAEGVIEAAVGKSAAEAAAEADAQAKADADAQLEAGADRGLAE
jgi:hypothetical protein